MDLPLFANFFFLLSHPLLFMLVFGGLALSIAVHEFFHAWTADQLGDPTPRIQGRVTLNPLKHLDPLGTLMLLLVGFGWGKPVEFDPYNLKNPIRDAALIALVGPASNIVIAMILGLLLRFDVFSSQILVQGVLEIMMLNVVLAVFNLIPVYPLDGSKILLAALPKELAFEYDQFMHRYGMFVLLALLIPWFNGISPAQALIVPIINTIGALLLGL